MLAYDVQNHLELSICAQPEASQHETFVGIVQQLQVHLS
jgi:hypothetical protein